MRTLLIVLAFLAAGLSRAEACRPELEAGLAPDRLAAAPTGLDAARLLERAVDLVEPALPRLDWMSPPPLADGASGAATARFLKERRLLPDGWRPDALDRTTWAAMLDEFAGWYDLDPVPVRDPATTADLVADLTEALERIGDAVRPVALVATDPDVRARVSFLGVIWNWSVYPRLLVYRPPADFVLDADVPSVLPLLGTCAVHVAGWIAAPEPTARRLFQSNLDGRMVVVGSTPEREDAWPREVADGEEEAYFDFDHPEVAGAAVYSTVFLGARPGPGTFLRLLPSVRTNLSPAAFLRVMQAPPRD